MKNSKEVLKKAPNGKRLQSEFCIEADCTEKPIGNDFCGKHYMRARRRGFLGLSPEEALEKQHDINLWSHHRIRLVDARIMWVSQGCICACCKKLGPAIYTPSREWVIDHNHQCCPSSVRRECGGSCTRGIVCEPCNKLLTVSMQDVVVYEAIGKYLGHIQR